MHLCEFATACDSSRFSCGPSCMAILQREPKSFGAFYISKLLRSSPDTRQTGQTRFELADLSSFNPPMCLHAFIQRLLTLVGIKLSSMNG